MAVTPTDYELKYSFLKVRKEKEAILMGINPTNKHQHELLKLIRSLNTIQNAGKGMLFTLKNAYLEQLQIDLKTATNNLTQLVNNLLITQVPVLEYDSINMKLNSVCYYLTHPAEDKSYSIYMIFEELVAYSFHAVKKWYENREPLSKELILKELSWQYAAKPNEEYSGNSIIFEPRKKIYSASVPILSPPEMIDYIIQAVTHQIYEANMGIDIEGHGILLFKPGEVLDIFEAASEFMMQTMLPVLLDEFSSKFRLEPILTEKQVYELDKSTRKTSKYLANIAREIKSILSQNTQNPLRFPGSLTLEIITKLESLADEKYAGKWREECDKIKRDFKKNITTPSNKWNNLIEFIPQENVFNYHPEVWKELIHDPDLFYTKWQIPKTTMHVFTGKEIGFIRTLVLGMTGLQNQDLWKAQALKNIIETNEKRLRPLLIDPKFTVIYNELVRRIYIQYIPWYFRIFLYFPLNIFMDSFIEDAKKKIILEQEALTKKNDANNSKLQAEYAKEKVEIQERLKDQLLVNSIKATLDSFLMKEKRLPILDEVKQLYLDEGRFNRVIKKFNFKIIKVSTKGVEDVEVLLYPAGTDFGEKKKMIQESLNSIVTEKNPHISTNYDKASYERAQKLLEILNND